MRSFKEKFESNYAAALVNENGKERVRYIYYAPWYFWDFHKKDCRIYRNLAVALFVIELIAFFIFSTITSEVNSFPIVSLFIAVSLILRIFELIAIIRLCISRKKATEMTYQSVNITLKAATLGVALLMFLAAMWGFFATKKEYVFYLTVIVSCGYILCAALSVAVGRLYAAITFHTEKNNELDKYEH